MEKVIEIEGLFRRFFYESQQPLSVIKNGRFIAANSATLNMLGMEEERQLIGLSPVDISPDMQPDGEASAAKAIRMIEATKDHGWHAFDWEHVRLTGEKFIAHVLLTFIPDGSEGFIHVVWSDITSEMRKLEDLEIRANFDELTGLINRRGMLDRMKLLSGERRHGAISAVLMMDIDRFKQINDTLGHLAGDYVLQVIAERIRSIIRESDFAGRIGGDEFMVLLSGLEKFESAINIAEKIRTAVKNPIFYKGAELTPSISIGATLVQSGNTAKDLIAHADAALYQAKNTGRDKVIEGAAL